ncbi:hypothetical protein TIFTF001_046457 [Ficus carica]|uniref:Transmembrane protein n=1 Tax=Ficus carica TaxID=3494 RepID=A0AA87Z5X9_FICCA|nr:hypothetical protein TIFTF001_046457 [Ficus carica]
MGTLGNDDGDDEGVEMTSVWRFSLRLVADMFSGRPTFLLLPLEVQTPLFFDGGGVEGPISGPKEAEFILKRTTGVHGFYRASTLVPLSSSSSPNFLFFLSCETFPFFLRSSPNFYFRTSSLAAAASPASPRSSSSYSQNPGSSFPCFPVLLLHLPKILAVASPFVFFGFFIQTNRTNSSSSSKVCQTPNPTIRDKAFSQPASARHATFLARDASQLVSITSSRFLFGFDPATS